MFIKDGIHFLSFSTNAIPFYSMIPAWIITLFFVHYLYRTLLPKMIISRNKHAINNISLSLQERSIQLLSNGKTKDYKRGKVYAVKELDTSYCIVFPRNFYIVIPKNSGLSEQDKSEYFKYLEKIIEEIKRSSKHKSKN